jgi:hypothetical protein
MAISDAAEESATEWSHMNECKTDEEEDDDHRTLSVEVGQLADVAEADRRSELSIPEGSPESLEHIVEQLVLQNVEIQRILQRQKRRANRSHPPPVNRAEATDEGIYDSLIISPPISSVDGDGDYVTIRSDSTQKPMAEIPPADKENGDVFNRCQMRRSLGSLQHRKPPETAPISAVEAPDPSRTTVSRSLSCPARQAIRIARKSDSDGVAKRIHKLLNQIGSAADHWPSWMRSLSPPHYRHRRRDSLDNYDLKMSCDPKLTSATSPCVPSVWLRMQSEHLADPNKKSGSLPRSFQVNLENKSRWSDRPVTIASDRPAPIDLQTETLDLYLRTRSKRSEDQSSMFSQMPDAEFQSTNGMAG